jgi:hypothetical protein
VATDPSSGFEQALEAVLPSGQVVTAAIGRLAYAYDTALFGGLIGSTLIPWWSPREVSAASATGSVTVSAPSAPKLRAQMFLAEERRVAYPHPQFVVRFYHGVTGELLFVESVVAALDNQSGGNR